MVNKRLWNKAETEKLLAAMRESAAAGPRAWNRFYDEYVCIPAVVEFPAGEITNKSIAGYVGAWRMLGKIEHYNIEPGDRFNAQGLEGKIAIRTDLIVALNVYGELPANRCQVKA